MTPGQSPFVKIPNDTYQAARQVYSPSHIYLSIGDQKGDLFATVNVRLLDPFTELDDETVSRLAMVTAFQYAESIPDIVASDATRRRIDWKYALHLPIHHHGVTGRALCAFRQSLFVSQTALHEFDKLLNNLGKAGLFSQTTHDQVNSNDVLLTVCKVTRLNQLYMGMKTALSVVVIDAPDWLRAHMPSHWFTRYKTGQLFQTRNASQEDLNNEAEKIGADIRFLVSSLREHTQDCWHERTEFNTIIHLLDHQFAFDGDQLRWRLPMCGGRCNELQGEIKF